eukprot:5371196-Prymnesium_polylepis.1
MSAGVATSCRSCASTGTAFPMFHVTCGGGGRAAERARRRAHARGGGAEGGAKRDPRRAVRGVRSEESEPASRTSCSFAVSGAERARLAVSAAYASLHSASVSNSSTNATSLPPCLAGAEIGPVSTRSGGCLCTLNLSRRGRCIRTTSCTSATSRDSTVCSAASSSSIAESLFCRPTPR